MVPKRIQSNGIHCPVSGLAPPHPEVAWDRLFATVTVIGRVGFQASTEHIVLKCSIYGSGGGGEGQRGKATSRKTVQGTD